MKRTPIHVVAAGLLLSGASLIQAQEPTQLLRIFREDIKSGKGAAHEKVESSYVRALSKSGYPSYTAWVNMTGTSQAWFIERYDTYEAMEKAIHLTDAEPMKSTLEGLDAQDGESASAAVEQIVRAKSGVALIEASSILEHHWLATKMLASELRERGVVRRDRAQDILDRWMPVRGGSMLEALGYQ